jgi:hypothetical protein
LTRRSAEARKAVQDNAAKKVDVIKIWVDDRMGTVKKLSPELYAAVIDEAHKNGLRVIAHIYTLDQHPVRSNRTTVRTSSCEMRIRWTTKHAEGLVCVLARRIGGPLVVQVGASERFGSGIV